MASSTALRDMPPIFVLAANMSDDDRHDIEERLERADAPLTYDIKEARIVVGNINTKRRAELELRMLRLWTEDARPSMTHQASEEVIYERERSVKRRKITQTFTQEQLEDATVISDDESSTQPEGKRVSRTTSRTHPTNEIGAATVTKRIEHGDSVNSVQNIPEGVVYVVKIAWLKQVLEQEQLLPIEGCLVYVAVPKPRPPSEGWKKQGTQSDAVEPRSSQTVQPDDTPESQATLADLPDTHSSILERAQGDAPPRDEFQPIKNGRRRFYDRHEHHDRPFARSKEKATLLQSMTTDYESNSDVDIPEPPDWVKRDVKYACMRRTPAEQANAEFITVLKQIRTTRELVGDEIGVRAYSTSIAAIAAYPYRFQHPREILSIPGCEVKIANLWIEWKNTDGHVKEAEDAEKDEVMRVLKAFYDIWGVGATTAREFYHERGWRSRDDVVDFGWDTLNRVQQIGLKYYDEFLEGIPRSEVELIASVVNEHAVRVRDTGIEVLVVGGYRRGKELSGDVDIIVSHRQLEKTANLVTDIIASLETDEWITHTLLLTVTGTHRGQATLPFRGGIGGGHGFDTLDKALVVWQDPRWADRPELGSTIGNATTPGAAGGRENGISAKAEEEQLRALRKANPNRHRRVDIIVSPWRTVGCAVLGWSGGTTFQRDIRRYVKNVKGWKFDSSGIRDRRSGLTLDIEGPEGVLGQGQGMVDAEKRVFEGMGLDWIPPEDRWTH